MMIMKAGPVAPVLAVVCLLASQLFEARPAGEGPPLAQGARARAAEQLTPGSLAGADNDGAARQAGASADDGADYAGGRAANGREPLAALKKPLRPGEQQVMVLDLDEAGGQRLASQLAQTKQQVRRVSETLPDGRVVTYEIVDELIEDEDEGAAEEELERETEEGRMGDGDEDEEEEVGQVGEVEVPVAPATAGVAPGPSGRPASAGSKQTPAQAPMTVSNNANASIQLAGDGGRGEQKAGAGTQDAPERRQKPLKAEGEDTKPLAGQPAAKADALREPHGPAKAEQRAPERATDQQQPDKTTKTTASAAKAQVAPAGSEGGGQKAISKPEHPEALDGEHEAGAPKAQQQQPKKVALKGVGNTKRKVVDKLEKNSIKVEPNELSVEDSGNVSEEIIRDHKVNETVQPKRSIKQKSTGAARGAAKEPQQVPEGEQKAAQDGSKKRPEKRGPEGQSKGTREDGSEQEPAVRAARPAHENAINARPSEVANEKTPDGTHVPDGAEQSGATGVEAQRAPSVAVVNNVELAGGDKPKGRGDEDRGVEAPASGAPALEQPQQQQQVAANSQTTGAVGHVAQPAESQTGYTSTSTTSPAPSLAPANQHVTHNVQAPPLQQQQPQSQQHKQTVVEPGAQTVVIEEKTTVHDAEDGDEADGDDSGEDHEVIEEVVEEEEGGGGRRRGGRRGGRRRRRGGWGHRGRGRGWHHHHHHHG